MHQKTDDDGDRKTQGSKGHLLHGAVGPENTRHQVNQQGAHRHPEHGDRDGHKGEVVPHGHAEDAGQQNFKHKGGERHQEKADVG